MPEELTPTELAKELGWSIQRVAWHRSAKTDAPKGNNLKEWQAYAAAHGYVVGNTSTKSAKKISEAIARAKLDILEETRTERKRRNRLAENELYDAKEVTQYVSNLVAYFFGELERLAAEYPVSLKGKTEIPISQECKEQTIKIKEGLRRRVATWDQGHNSQTEVPQ